MTANIDMYLWWVSYTAVSVYVYYMTKGKQDKRYNVKQAKERGKG